MEMSTVERLESVASQNSCAAAASARVTPIPAGLQPLNQLAVENRQPHSSIGAHSASQPNNTREIGSFDSGAPGRSKSASYHVLYTKQKTQKRKVWHDGRLDLNCFTATLWRAELLPGNSKALDSCAELSTTQVGAIHSGALTTLEMEHYMVEIEGPWTNRKATQTASQPIKNTASHSMQKLLQKKYRKPPFKAPPRSQQTAGSLATRKRPLQPGELHQQHYGTAQHQAFQSHPQQHYHQSMPPPQPGSQHVQQCHQPPPPQGMHHQPKSPTPPLPGNQHAPQSFQSHANNPIAPPCLPRRDQPPESTVATASHYHTIPTASMKSLHCDYEAASETPQQQWPDDRVDETPREPSNAHVSTQTKGSSRQNLASKGLVPVTAKPSLKGCYCGEEDEESADDFSNKDSEEAAIAGETSQQGFPSSDHQLFHFPSSRPDARPVHRIRSTKEVLSLFGATQSQHESIPDDAPGGDNPDQTDEMTAEHPQGGHFQLPTFQDGESSDEE